MSSRTAFAKALVGFLNESCSVFHAALATRHFLEGVGFVELSESERWTLKPGQGYFTERNGSAIVAFRTPADIRHMVPARIVASHLDSPALRLKPEGAREWGGTLVIPTEIYGSPIYSTWFDKPLGIAGRVSYLAEGRVGSKLVKLDSAAVLPNPAPHLCRNINNGFVYNPQSQMKAMLGNCSMDGWKAALELPAGAELLSHELFLFDDTTPAITGLKGDMVVSPHLDNLASVFANLQALKSDKPGTTLSVALFADNEEIGSHTPQGADSNFLANVLKRIYLAFGGDEQDFMASMASSVLLSCDAAHALNPNFPEGYDPSYAPVLGGGVVIKRNVSGKYITDALSGADFMNECRIKGVPYQLFTNRADAGCGSTVGPVIASQLGIRGIDLGIALWAMHSARETASVSDIIALQHALENR